MFPSIRGCAESMLPMCQLKVKITVEGQISNNQILDNISCLLCKSFTNWKIFFKLGSNFQLNTGCTELMLPMCQLKVKVTIEGQISNNQILDSMPWPLCKSYTYWKIFFNLCSNVHLNKVMCKTHVTLSRSRLKVKNWFIKCS
jgi:hypothetical protein